MILEAETWRSEYFSAEAWERGGEAGGGAARPVEGEEAGMMGEDAAPARRGARWATSFQLPAGVDAASP